MDKVLAWHFLPEDRHMRWGKWRNPVREGITYVTHKPLVLCESGLHASERAIDALQYAPGPVVCRVECSGEIVRGSDKLVCSRRKVLWMADATRVLHLFACDVAEQALALLPQPDPRSVEAIRVKRAWLDGKATDEDLAAASAAARDAVWDAAWDAAWAAASAAAWDAASAAASAAEWAAAWAASWDKQNDMLTAALESLHNSSRERGEE